jgi:hypothetical protein
MGQGLEVMRRAQARRRKEQELYTPNRALQDYGSQAVASVGLTPFIRENDINFAARNLKPDATPNFFFDEIKVNNFTQRASVINVNSSAALSTLKINEGIYGLTSNAYAEVLGTSRSATQNLIYVNDNYISFEVNKGATAVDLSVSDFQVGDLVYQTVTDSPYSEFYYTGKLQPEFTFLGKVKKWIFNPSTPAVGVLVVEPILGTANITATSTASDSIWNLTRFYSDEKLFTKTYANNRFQAGETLVFASNDNTLTGNVLTSQVSATNSYLALSSAVSAANTNNLKSIVLSSNNISRDGISDVVGNTLYIVSGTNMGFSSQISSVASNTQFGWTELILNQAMPELPTSNTIYSISNHKVDDVGALYGILHIPSADNLRWLTGERVFTVTDTATFNDNGYRMRAIAKYNALGKINTQTNARNVVLRELTPNTLQAPAPITEPNRKINDRKYMAQTFSTPLANEIVNGQVKESYGIFVSSIDLFFKSKPTDPEEQLPFTVAISKVVNGLPDNDIIAERTLEPAYINVSNTPDTSNTATLTKFRFQDPVYLEPSTEYAIKLITESPDYQVWTSTLGGTYTDNNGNVRTVSDQPYVGSFFTSMNASNWNPILNQDLMFVVNRANFSPNKTLFFTADPDEDLTNNVLMDEVKIAATEQQFAPTNITYEVKSLLTDGTTVTDYVKLENNEIYKFGKDTDISSLTAKRRRLIPRANVASLNVKVTMTTTDTRVSPVINRERFSIFALQNIINNAGIANNLISITSPGSHVNATNITVTISAPDVGANNATANVTPALLSGGGVVGINIINPGSGYFTTPTITISEPGVAANAIAVINGETDIAGGNNLAKYQTKIVELESGFDAGDLIVKMNAIKPQGTNIQVYFKVLSGLDPEPISAKKWQLMTVVNNNISPDQTTLVPIEYRYAIDKGQIEYFDGNKAQPLGGTFKYFAVKIRMTASDPTVVPMIEDLRVIAVPGEVPVLNDVDGGFYSA